MASASEISSWLSAVHSSSASPAASAARASASASLDALLASADFALLPTLGALAQADQPLPARHLALQLAHQLVRFRFPQPTAPPEAKLALKAELFRQTAEAELPALLVQGLARPLVELAKLGWPQEWPDFLRELETGASLEVGLATLVLLLEDVVSLQTVSNTKRRAELRAAILDALPAFLAFAERGFALGAQKSALRLLGELLGWIPADKAPKDLSAVAQRLGDPELRDAALAALMELVSRKSNPKNQKELEPVLLLLQAPVLETMLEAASAAGAEEEEYEFLKGLAGLLCQLGTQLAALWPHRPPPLDRLDRYLAALFALQTHPSVALRSQAAAVEQTLAAVPDIRAALVYRAHLASFVGAAPGILAKSGTAGDPPEAQASAATFAELDYGDGEGTRAVTDLAALRGRVYAVLQHSLKADAEPGWRLLAGFCERLCRGDLDGAEEYDPLVKLSQKFLEAAVELDKAGQLTKLRPSREELLEGLLAAMEGLSGTSPETYRLANNQLAVVGTLVSGLPANRGRFERLLQLFARHMETTADVEELRFLKLHICSHLILLCRGHAGLLDPAQLVRLIAERWWPLVTAGQRSKLVEAVALLANHFPDPAEQAGLLGQILASSLDFLKRPEVRAALESPEKLMEAVGLSVAPPLSEEADACLAFRKEAMGQLGILEAVATRSSAAPVAALFTQEGNQEALFALFSLARSLNGLPTAAAALHPGYAPWVLDVAEVDRLTIQLSNQEQLNAASESGRFRRSSPAHHLQAFLNDATDKLQLVLGAVLAGWGDAFWALPQAPLLLSAGALGHLPHVLDLRLRFWLRRLWTPAVVALNRPAASDTARSAAETPLLELAEHCLERLSGRWAAVAAAREALGGEGGELQVREMFLADVTAVLSRELAQFLKALVCAPPQAANGSSANGDAGHSEAPAEDDEEMGGEAKAANGSASRSKVQPSALVQKLLSSQRGFGALVQLLFVGLSWEDSLTSMRLLPLCRALLPAVTPSAFLDAASAGWLVARSLDCLAVNGRQEGVIGPALTLAAELFASLRERFPDAASQAILERTGPDSSGELESLGPKLGSLCEKARKEAMRKLLRGVIGRNVSEAGRREQRFRDLPPLLRRRRLKQVIADAADLTSLFGGQ